MFLTHIKTLLVKAIQNTFDDEYPVDQYRGIYTSIEYPEKALQYPAIWVDFDVNRMEPIGIDTVQYEATDTGFFPYKTWRFEGRAEFTIVAMTSLERDGLYDEMVKIIAFGSLNSGRSTFRNTIDNNEYIRTVFNWDKITTQGMITSKGTPWGSSELIYEVSITMEVYGEFSSDHADAQLVALSDVTIHPYPVQTMDS